ncbi:MAG: type I DNA topoisomerase [Victivallaceae bacterium]
MKKLLIVESPTKARTITRMLGQDYTILASMGHVRDLPEHAFGVDLEHDFTPLYVDTPRSSKIVKELRAAAKKADEIYLAPDPDREGEAIAWHLAEVLKDATKHPFHRVTFHEITKSAIQRALDEKTSINLDLVDAQQARRVLDRIVGYQVSPLLWSRLEKGISAGRVQSVALRLVVEREREILNFVPEEYWVFSLVFRIADGREFAARLFKIDGKDFKVGNLDEARALLDAVLKGSAPEVAKVTTAERRRNAPPPFTTSTLQQAASNNLHYTATNTMRFAQNLYEGVELGAGGPVGLITYMRTDSVTIAREAQEAAREFIVGHYGPNFAPAKPNYFKNKAAAQEAHEAIRPTDVNRTPESLAPFLESSELKLYTLIWKRFVASQMSPCIQNLTTVDAGVRGADRREYTFRATATVPVFAGFTAVYNDEGKAKDESIEEAALLGSLREREKLAISSVEKEQKFTEPPPRYTEASLIKELEENGIGRPSTYASILRTIQQRDYVTREQGKLVPSELGFRVTDFLVEHLPELFDVGFTAEMERKLDEIENGSVKWTKMMADFYQQFGPWLEKAKHSDAPASENAELLIRRLANLQFAPPDKRGKRTYDDGKFYRSVAEAFAEKGKITARQYQALLALAAKYESQLGGKVELPEALAEDLKAANERIAAREEKAAATAVSDELKGDYQRLFAAFDKVTWEAPTARRGRTYDDKKFFTSLKRQALDGKMLSEKQLGALARMAEKYQGELTDADFVRTMLAIPAAAPAATGDDSGKGAAADNGAAAMLERLAKVTEWAAPTKKGRFTYDDRTFFESIAKQHEAGRTLSPKQLAALSKMDARYAKKAE